jgi:hypothetical protein
MVPEIVAITLSSFVDEVNTVRTNVTCLPLSRTSPFVSYQSATTGHPNVSSGGSPRKSKSASEPPMKRWISR